MAKFAGPSLALFAILLALVADEASGGVSLKSLPVSFTVNATIDHRDHDYTNANVAKAGTDAAKVSWAVKQGTDDKSFKKLKVKLCFSEESQKDRSWRKANDDLSKDKSCPILMGTSLQISRGSITWTIADDTPRGIYYCRIYALDSQGTQLAYGESPKDEAHFLTVDAVSGRSISLDFAAAVCSAVSVLSVFGFLGFEKWQTRRRQLLQKA